ncbi:macrolide family glycosyltransferase [Streptococcus dentiloxodontae]
MKRIIFMGVPAFGHTNPTLMLIKKLTEKGHDVCYYSVSDFRETLENYGADVVCYDEKIDSMTIDHINQLTYNQSAHFAILLSFLSEAAGDILENYSETIKRYRPDVIVGDSLAIWARIIANRLEIPFVLFNTHFAFNEHTPNLLNEASSEGKLRMILQYSDIMTHYKKLKKLGYPTQKITDLALTREDSPVIVTTSRDFQPAGHTFSERVHFVGPIIRDSQAKWDKTDRPLVYISLGTVNNQAKDFYKNCLKGLSHEQVDVVLSVGKQTDIAELGLIPDNFQIYHKVNQIAVLQAADVFLTHCGLNSTSEGLYYQVPLLLFPQTAEQDMVANRVLALGAGLRLDNDKPENIADAVKRLLTDSKYKKQAQKISQDFVASGGCQTAVELILDACSD